MIDFRKRGLGVFQGLFVFFILFLTDLNAQTVHKINCLMPYEISFDKLSQISEEIRKVEFENHDDHTFWYKIQFNENEKFSYRIESMDDQKSFDIYFYQYDGSNFCRSFIQNNLELISFENNLEQKVLKGSVYYLGVYPLFPGGCGHKISLKSGGNILNLEIKKSGSSCNNQEVVINPDPILGKQNIAISGKVLDDVSNNKINARISFIDPFTGHQKQIFSTQKEGFSIDVLEDGDYKVMIQAFGYKDEITAISAQKGESYTFRLKSSDRKNYVLNNVYFYPNTYALKDESVEELESIFSYLVNHPSTQIKVVGHTNGDKDVKASRFVKEEGEEWNFSGTAKELSFRRASKIKDYLTVKGIDELNIKADGKGGEEMIVKEPLHMSDAMKNIRVEITIVSQN